MNGLGFPIRHLGSLKRSFLIPNGASDLAVGLTGRELYLTFEGNALEHEATMAAIKADVDDRIFMLKVPQTDNRPPAVFRNEKYLQIFGFDVVTPSAFIPQFEYVKRHTISRCSVHTLFCNGSCAKLLTLLIDPGTCRALTRQGHRGMTLKPADQTHCHR